MATPKTKEDNAGLKLKHGRDNNFVEWRTHMIVTCTKMFGKQANILKNGKKEKLLKMLKFKRKLQILKES